MSVATFAVGVNWLIARDIAFESQMAVFLAVMEVPAISAGDATHRSAPVTLPSEIRTLLTVITDATIEQTLLRDLERLG